MAKRSIVPFGPQHPVLPEPVHLDLVLEDETVVGAIPSIGYVHRGLEKLVEKRDFKQYSYIAERICGICSCGVQEGVLFEDTQRPQEMKELKVYTADHAFLEMIQGSDIYVTVWNKLYTRETAGAIPFRKGKCHEDEFWSWRVIDRAEKVAAVGNPLYGYRQREESIMNSRYSIRRLDLLDAREDRQRLFEQKYPGLVRKGKCDLRFECIRAWQFSLLYLSGEDRKKSRKKIRNMIRRHPVSLADCAGLPVGRKFWYLLSGISFEGTCRIRNRFHFGP